MLRLNDRTICVRKIVIFIIFPKQVEFLIDFYEYTL